jgi:hypothetical protein
MRFAGRKEKRIPCKNFRCAMVITHFPRPETTTYSSVFRAMPMVGAIAFSFWNPNLGEIKGMSFGQVERFLFASERDRNVFDEFVEFTFGRLAFVFRDVVEIHFAHDEISIKAHREASKN